MNNNGLISRQTAIDKLFEYAESKFQSGEIELANGILKAKCFLESPCNIPTAYNVDKVLEQLENEKKFWNDATYNKEIGKQKARSYAYAIEIVKGGGIDA